MQNQKLFLVKLLDKIMNKKAHFQLKTIKLILVHQKFYVH